MKKLLAIFALMFAAGTLLMGCNTIQGAGKDLERGGEKIQDKAKNVQQNR